MSAPPITATPWTWPAKVLDFADRQGVRPHLDPLREAIQRVFPTARDVKILLEEDAEIRDDWYIVFEVYVPAEDVPDYYEAKQPWYREFFRLCPKSHMGAFRLSLFLVSA